MIMGKQMPEPGDPRWRLAVGLILLLAMICTVIALITMNVGGGAGGADASDPPAGQSGDAQADVSDADVSPSPSPSTAPSQLPSPSPSPQVDSVSVTWAYFNGEYQMTIPVGDEVQLEAKLSPSDTEAEVTWSTKDAAVCTVTDDGLIKGVGAGKTTITATADGKTGEVEVIVSAS